MNDIEKIRELAESKDTDMVPMDWPIGTIRALCKEVLRLHDVIHDGTPATDHPDRG